MDPAVHETAPGAKRWKFENGDQVVSINSRFTVNMCFTNRTPNTVEVLWVNFNGEEVSYGQIEPGATNLLYTYLTHPWVFRNLADHEEVLVVKGKPVAWPNQTSPFADITAAPFLPWSTATHATFRDADPAFARDVRNLLMAYHAQRKVNGRSCDVAGCRGGCAASVKSRRSSTGGALDSDMSPIKVAVHCCGVQLRHWRGLEGCNALRTAPSHSPSHATSNATPGTGAAVAASDPAGQHHAVDQTQPEDGLLGQLPYDIILEIIAKMAPKVRDYKPVLKEDMEMMPHGVEPATGPVPYLASQLLGPAPPPAPVAEPEVWFAAVNAGAIAGMPPQIFMEIGGLVAQAGPLAPPVAVGVLPLPHLQAAEQGAVAAAPAAAVAMPPQVAEIILFTEAAVLANTAMSHAARMTLHQNAQSAVLFQQVTALNNALTAANAAMQQLQQQQLEGPAPAGGGEGEQGPAAAQEQEQGGEQGDGESEYSDVEEQEGDNGVGEAGADGGTDGDEAFEDADDLWAGPIGPM